MCHLDFVQLRRAARQSLRKPALEALGKVTYRLSEGRRNRAQHIRYEHVDEVLVELVVSGTYEREDGGTTKQRL